MAVFLFAAAAVTAAAAFEGNGSKTVDLFFISKSNNLNRVMYEARLDDRCQFDPEVPVHPYWQRLESGAGEVRELKWFEIKFAYGVEVTAQSANEVWFSIAADHSRPVVVRSGRSVVGCQAQALTMINGRFATPISAHVDLRERRVLFPKINFVDLVGSDAAGQAACERVTEVAVRGVPCPKDSRP